MCPRPDAHVLPQGTAYITDLGMTGPYDSVLGRDKEAVVQSLVTGVPRPYVVATQDTRLCGVIVETDDATGRATSIEQISIEDPLPGEHDDD
jgi:calcineurin-like phosphoesterase